VAWRGKQKSDGEDEVDPSGYKVHTEGKLRYASLQGSDAVSSEAIAAPVGPTVAFTSINNRCGTTSQPHQ